MTEHVMLPGWIEVVDSVTGEPVSLNVTYISVITPVDADHTSLVAAQSAGKTEIIVAEPYASLQQRLYHALANGLPGANFA